ncbi:hypothetical protein ACFV06_09650 [Streptomyces sp. NPDC059618]|uniref:hypothetical protein n=1 Tax=Streptomyces sp. NPDC059618 TaxID=3346887 RepID=UPI00368DAAD0
MTVQARTTPPPGALRLLFARRARRRAEGPARPGPSAEADPNTPDVWLALLRLRG